MPSVVSSSFTSGRFRSCEKASSFFILINWPSKRLVMEEIEMTGFSGNLTIALGLFASMWRPDVPRRFERPRCAYRHRPSLCGVWILLFVSRRLSAPSTCIVEQWHKQWLASYPGASQLPHNRCLIGKHRHSLASPRLKPRTPILKGRRTLVLWKFVWRRTFEKIFIFHFLCYLLFYPFMRLVFMNTWMSCFVSLRMKSK